MATKRGYVVIVGDTAYRTSKAVECIKDGKTNGWLNYELNEGGTITRGLAKPGTWKHLIY